MKLAKGVPYLGAAIGVLNYFVFQEEKDDKPSTTAVSFNATVNVTGSISHTASTNEVLFEVPGSRYDYFKGSSVNQGETPMYDEPLGVISLLNTPTVEFSNINSARSRENPDGLSHITQDFPTVTEYKVVDPLELVINPSSELILEDAKASIVLTYRSTPEKDFENPLTRDQLLNYPYIPGATISQTSLFDQAVGWRVSNIGTYSDDDWQKAISSDANLELQEPNQYYKISYGQSPLSCFHGKSFYLISEERPTFETLPILVIRLNITMRNPTTGRLYKFVQSYEIDKTKLTEIERETQHYDVDVLDSYFFLSEAHHLMSVTTDFILQPYIGSIFSNYYQSGNIKDFRFYENETISGFIDAWDGIVIGDNVIIEPGTWITAGRYIQIHPENKFNPEVKMQIGIRDATCLDEPENFVVSDANYLNTWCELSSAGTYNPVATKRDFITEKGQKEEKEYNFNLYPNPTDNLVNIEVDLIDMATYTIDVLDVSGRAIYNRTASSQEFNNNTWSINTSSFESGIYFVNVRQGAHTMTKQLVITR